jgi:hypothetical protein
MASGRNRSSQHTLSVGKVPLKYVTVDPNPRLFPNSSESTSSYNLDTLIGTCNNLLHISQRYLLSSLVPLIVQQALGTCQNQSRPLLPIPHPSAPRTDAIIFPPNTSPVPPVSSKLSLTPLAQDNFILKSVPYRFLVNLILLLLILLPLKRRP